MIDTQPCAQRAVTPHDPFDHDLRVVDDLEQPDPLFRERARRD